MIINNTKNIIVKDKDSIIYIASFDSSTPEKELDSHMEKILTQIQERGYLKGEDINDLVEITMENGYLDIEDYGEIFVHDCCYDDFAMI